MNSFDDICKLIENRISCQDINKNQLEIIFNKYIDTFILFHYGIRIWFLDSQIYINFDSNIFTRFEKQNQYSYKTFTRFLSYYINLKKKEINLEKIWFSLV